MRLPKNLWDSATAPAAEIDLLIYRSNLLGSDHSVTNFGGGNTSVKTRLPDPLTGEPVDTLYIKGSGGDLGTLQRSGIAHLYLDKIVGLERVYRGLAFEDEMAALLPHCAFGPQQVASSIDTPLHALLPFKHIDHVHPDAVVAVAATSRVDELTQEIFQGKLGWLPWQRPGFDLALNLRELVARQPELHGVILAGHGLFTWADSAEDCYRRTLWAIRKAASAINKAGKSTPRAAPAKNTRKVKTTGVKLSAATRREAALEVMPLVRRLVSTTSSKIGHFVDSPPVLDFVRSDSLRELAQLGTSCPDHFLRTKIRPLVLASFDPELIEQAIDRYRAEYAAYYQRCADKDSPAMRDPNPVIVLVPDVGMLGFAADKATARIACEFYLNAINVIEGARLLDEYQGLDEQEAFDIEYWALEEAKLKSRPAPRALAGRVALVTGGAGGIGSAIAERLLAEHACVVLADIDDSSMIQTRDRLAEAWGSDRIACVNMDVTDESSVVKGFADAQLYFGGLDILVANAGIASSAPITETSEALWQKNFDILSKGYFLTSKAAFSAMNPSGNIVFIASKNGLAAANGASAYAAAKASELHLARCLALEGAEKSIRVNSVNPDAVLQGSKIWSGSWRDERAKTYGIKQDKLEQHYISRSLLKKAVLPQDVAEAVYFFVSDASAKSTGNMLNVDAGNAAAFPR